MIHDTRPFLNTFIYLHHTKELYYIPCLPESVSDSIGVNYSQSNPLSRSAPIYSFVNSGPRQFQVSIRMHREEFINYNTSGYSIGTDKEDAVDRLMGGMYAMAVPRYAASEKMVDPPVVSVRLGDDIYCKGVINGAVGVSYEPPVLKNGKYAVITISFSIYEIDPYDADMSEQIAGYRPGSGEITMNTSLEGPVYSGQGAKTPGAYHIGWNANARV